MTAATSSASCASAGAGSASNGAIFTSGMAQVGMSQLRSAPASAAGAGVPASMPGMGKPMPPPVGKPVQPGTSSGKKRSATFRSAASADWKNLISAADVRSQRLSVGQSSVLFMIGASLPSPHSFIDQERSYMTSMLTGLRVALALPVPQAASSSIVMLPSAWPASGLMTGTVPVLPVAATPVVPLEPPPEPPVGFPIVPAVVPPVAAPPPLPVEGAPSPVVSLPVVLELQEYAAVASA